jgi:glycine/D-amino acid oxidase-like deaminating enzyme
MNFQFMGADQAAFSQNDGAVDPVLATRMLVDKAVSLGATLKTKCSVERARSTDAGNVVLETSCGDLEVDRYVLATGADPRAVETLCDMELPQRSTAGAIVLTKPMPRMINRLIAAPGAHLHQRNDGRIVLADQDGVPDTEAHAERLKNRPNRFPSREIAELHSGRILAPVAQYLPGIASAEVEDVFIGWRPLPIDGHPVLGTPNSRKEAYIAIMHSGVSLAPIVGEIVAREILGEHHAIELAPYRPDRNFEMIRRY